jgi:hypothetical protein
VVDVGVNTTLLSDTLKFLEVVYYESIKRELKISCIYECMCDQRLQTKTKEFMCLTYTGLFIIIRQDGVGTWKFKLREFIMNRWSESY